MMCYMHFHTMISFFLFFEKAKMVYIHNNQGTSLVQDVPKRTLKIRNVCQVTGKQKHALADTQTK